MTRPFAYLSGLVAVVAILAAALALAAGSSHAAIRHSVIDTPQCADPNPATRDPSNPLMLATRPGADPLNGASFFVDGPAHGAAAGAIARLIGIDTTAPVGPQLPGFSIAESWTTFAAQVQAALPQYQSNASAIQMLSKIASEPEVQRLSSYAAGGGPGAAYSQTQKLFCFNFQADPGSVPIINTYFLHADLGGCPTNSKILSDRPTFERRISEVAQGIGNRPVVLLLETDAIGSSKCMVKLRSLGQYETDLRYEVDTMAALPHAVVYVEAGYSDGNSPTYTAKVLNAVDVKKIRGFYTNDTHLNWTINEVNWGDKISKLTHGAHFVVNTAQNGNGPKLNPHPSTQGVEDLCNPPGRALGPAPTTHTGFPQVDAFLWTSIPGNSSGSCNGGPPGGTFWAARAISLAQNANGKLGPGYPSKPY